MKNELMNVKLGLRIQRRWLHVIGAHLQIIALVAGLSTSSLGDDRKRDEKEAASEVQAQAGQATGQSTLDDQRSVAITVI